MLLTNDFVVAADLEQVWAHLLDMENVAVCVPGAKVEEVVPPATYKGTIRLKIGPMTVTYRGQATLVSADSTNHEATIEMKAREARGQGSALATVRNRLEPVPEGTRVIAETELQITGPQAQFGKGMLEDVGGRVLAEFSARLERQINDGQAGADGRSEAGGAAAAAKVSGATARQPSGTDEDALDLNKVVSASLMARASQVVPIAASVVALAVVTLVWWRRRRHEPSFSP
ncbi:MAG: SRPBCC family protein [Acidimicrobiales bacterium]